MTIVRVGNPPKSPRVLRTSVDECPCGCGARKGYKPIFVRDEKGKPTIAYKPDDKGAPSARIIVLCKQRPDEIRASDDYRNAYLRWQRDSSTTPSHLPVENQE